MITLREIPIIGKGLIRLNNDIKNIGIPTAFNNQLKRTRTRLTVIGQDSETNEVLSKQPCLIVANHPHEFEVLAILSTLPKRDDIYLITNRRFVGALPNIDNNLIPVYMDHHGTKKVFHHILNKIGDIFNKQVSYSPEDEKVKNRESISKAAKCLKSGNLVIIFPGKRKLSEPWFQGVGHMLKEAANPTIHIVKIFSQGTSWLDCFRILPFSGIFLPKISLFFSKSITLEEVWQENPKSITSKLQENYNNWITTLKN